MLYREIIAVCSQIHTKHINILCGQNVEFFNIKPGGTYSITIGLLEVCFYFGIFCALFAIFVSFFLSYRARFFLTLNSSHSFSFAFSQADQVSLFRFLPGARSFHTFSPQPPRPGLYYVNSNRIQRGPGVA